MSPENKLYNWIMTATTLIFAITSMITVMISISAWKDERESVRPYLTFNQSPQVSIAESGQITFVFAFKNVGQHPAASLYCQTLIVDCSLADDILHKDQISMVNIIPQNTTAELMINLEQLRGKDVKNLNQHYLIIDLKYMDPVIDKNHEQIIYLRWGGSKNGQIMPLFHASKEDKKQILDYLQKK